jgi:hypothetical protein
MTFRPAKNAWAKAAEKLGPTPVDAAAAIDEYDAGVKAGRIKTLKTPWANLTTLARPLVPGSITMLYGTAGFGKSLWLLQLSYSLFAAGIPVRLYMLENDHRKHCNRLYCQLAGNSKLDDDDWIEASNGQVEAVRAPHRETVRAFGRCMSTSLSARVTYNDLIAWIERGCDEGVRYFAVDPITHAAQNDKPWIADPKFIDQAREHLEKHHASLVVMTHPTKGDGKRNTTAVMSGSKAFFDFTDCVLRMDRPEKDVVVRVVTEAGSYNTFANRTITIEKARNGRGTGSRIGLKFDNDTFLCTELGLVLKDSKKAKEQGYEAPATQEKPEDIANLFGPAPAKPAKPWMQKQSAAPPPMTNGDYEREGE